MVSEAMAAYLRKLKEKNGKLLLVMDLENTWKTSHGKTNKGIAVRWDSANIYENTTEQMADLIGALFLLMCKGDWCKAVDILTKHENAALAWIESHEKSKDKTPTDEEKARVKELNRMEQNKPKQGAEE